MATNQPLHPTPPPRQGRSARFVRRLGGAVRNALSAGIARAAGLRRPAAAPGHTVAQPAAARPTRLPRARRPRTAARPARAPAAPPTPSRPGWLARLLDRAARHLAPRRRGPVILRDLAFTPEAFPGLPAEFLEFLSTPLEHCDPDRVHAVFSALGEIVTACMSSGTPIADCGALFATVWDSAAPAFAATAAAPVAAAPPADAAPPPAPRPQPAPARVAAAPLPQGVPMHAPAAAALPAPARPARRPTRRPTGRPTGGRAISFRYSINFARRRSAPRARRVVSLSTRTWCYAARASP